ncbi:hypothetical protein [Thalassospira marina]|uniref:Uncharacterized protein n=1 Tax=Thalassospira marina TaxID=2048283 RepID=A0A2N3KZZ9_9PROT|nr:hypothetical protein [Thalassospira marina]AUG52219.1 hypothetical protein CSC3H3_05390 [Thalassospira marina]PKR56141.1 hypothetical protein COO20_02780 [Thalassospira marina]
MTDNKGSKIALAVAGLLLIAGAATAIAMTQDNADSMTPLTNSSAEQSPTGTTDENPSAEIGEAPAPGAPDANGTMSNDNTTTPMGSENERTDDGSAPVQLTPPAGGNTEDDSTLMKQE